MIYRSEILKVTLVYACVNKRRPKINSGLLTGITKFRQVVPEGRVGRSSSRSVRDAAGRLAQALDLQGSHNFRAVIASWRT
ncbi:hypothetical protein HEK616_71010 [Streptomyces nigrescens]|uniref:Uncharacterized protein n=1 Tax=Streptomyces nigrescens TaxID=1920 RepID=A0ABM8A533_STRNI|nr:hypothetical protein HEK616_71010 [Streptomyces nigrescens]